MGSSPIADSIFIATEVWLLFGFLNHIVVPRLSHWARNRLSDFFIAIKRFPLWIPLYFPAQPNCGDAQMAHGRRLVANLRVADRLFAGAHRFNEIGHVVIALVESFGV